MKEAISKAALKNYGKLGHHIQLQGRYYQPPRPDHNDDNLTNDPDYLNKTEYLENMEEWRKKIKAIEWDQPKFYALKLQYLSDVSLEENKRSDNRETIEQENNPVMLWDVIESTHKINTIIKVESVTKQMAARMAHQQMRQGTYESIITYKECFNNTLKTFINQGKPSMGQKDIVTDF